MYNVLKTGVFLGVVISLTGCGASEHFMQDDVYNTRTPVMPPGTDLNDVTDYATFVAKKEQLEKPERTTYVSPREYNDYFYYSQFMFYGYSPYAPITGLGYFGHSNYYHPMYGYGMNGMGMFFGNPYPYGYSSAYHGYYYPYYGMNSWAGGQSYYGSTSWYTPVSKPNTPKNLSRAHAGTSAGRMGSTTTNGVVSYPNQLIAKPNQRFSGVGRNTTIHSSPVVKSDGRNQAVNSGLSSRGTARPVVSGRPAASSERTGTYNRRMESNPSGVNTRTINNSNTRTSSPTIRSGSSSGRSISSPGSGGGSRSGGRR